MSVPVGSQLGPYKIIAPLGAGGMGVVYRARDTRLDRDVAIKVLPPGLLADEAARKRFRKEALALARVTHPHIAVVHDVGADQGVDYLVMECVPGRSLADTLKSGPMPEGEAVSLVAQIAEALEEAHEQHIVHRDLKPGNIMVTPRGQAKVLDFGLAQLLSRSEPGDLTRSVDEADEGGGTLPYMAPEQLRGEACDARTDIWALGAVLYEGVTGQRPFPEKQTPRLIEAILHQSPRAPRTLNPRLSPELERLLIKALEKDRGRRYQTAAELRADLDRVQRGLASGVPARGPRRKPLAVAVGLGGAILLVVVALLWAFVATRDGGRAIAPAEYVQLTDFNDAALMPALSSDGRMVTFIRRGAFGDSASRGQIYVKILPQGEPVQLTHDELGKEQPAFSPDGSTIVYTTIVGGFKWDSWQVPVLRGSPQPFLANASGLVWIDNQHVLYSEIKEGVHMGIVTATENGAGRRNIYMPPGEGAMAHRSALSPDRHWVLTIEMDGVGWLPCRLVPFDGSSAGRRVGPQDGQCTTAAWSPDGRWMYFSSNASGGFHIWRQRYPDGVPEQITSGPTEQEGTAITADGKYLITSMGLQQAAIWLHDSSGDRQLTSEGFALLPTMAPAGDRVFYLMRSVTSRAYVSGELWAVRLATGEKERILPGQIMSHYAISRDGKRVLFTSVGSAGKDGIRLADLDRRSPPRELTHGGEYRAFFGAPGEIVYMEMEPGLVRHLYRMKEDGSERKLISPEAVTYLIGVSPDGHWAAAGLSQASHAQGTQVKLFSAHDEESFLVCDTCSTGFGPGARQESPMLEWGMDNTSLFVSLRSFGLHTQRTVVLPYRSDRPLDSLWPKGLKSEKDAVANPGAKVLNESNVFPASAPSTYLFWRRATQSNLYRIPLSN